jgi:hypothetical protein
MAAVTRPLFIEQGATFTLGFSWCRNGPIDPATGNPTAGDPYDLTNCTARMQIRKTLSGPVLLAAATDSPLTASHITLGGVLGRVDIVLIDADTALLTTRTGGYDLEIQFPSVDDAPGRVVRVLEGPVTVDLNWTRVE